MSSKATRSDYRVPVPPGYVRELALWYCQDKKYYRMDVQVLGHPDIVANKMCADILKVNDLSIRGMGLDLRISCEAKFQQGQTLFVYLKLWDPLGEAINSLLSIFTFSRLMRLETNDLILSLGLRFESFAQGSNFEKALEFRDATRWGISDLARWCDNLARGSFTQAEQASKGLDLDNLLAEIEALRPDKDKGLK